MVESRDWTDGQKSALVERILRGELGLQAACERHAVTPRELEQWVHVYRREAQRAIDEEVLQAFASQGLALDDESAGEFSGRLGDMGVAELLQTIQMGRKDATICIEHEGGTSRIWCRAGEVIDAESGPLTGQEALYRLLTLREGGVQADFEKVRQVRTIGESSQTLLMEAARRSDEGSRVRERIGDMQIVYGPSEGVLAPNVDLPPEWIAVLRLFDGRRTLEGVVGASGLGDLETLTIVEQLLGSSWLVRRRTASAPTRALSPGPPALSAERSLLPVLARPRPSRSAPRSLLLGGVASAATALAVLAFFVATGRLQPVAAPAVGAGSAIEERLPALLPAPPPEPCAESDEPRGGAGAAAPPLSSGEIAPAPSR